MSYQFVRKPLENGSYEPEGIYLDCPFDKEARLVQTWGTFPEFYRQYSYNGVALNGYLGLGFDVTWPTSIQAVDSGRVSEIGFEPTGFERYIKIDHWWGESLYARISSVQIESGQVVERKASLALAGQSKGQLPQRFHFGIRIRPFNRFDGWGGFSDPMPYLNPTVLGNTIVMPDTAAIDQYQPLPMAVEGQNSRRA